MQGSHSDSTIPTIDNTESISPSSSVAPVTPAQNSEAQVRDLLAKLQDSANSTNASQERRSDAQVENRLALVRLGMATSLFYALRTKHPPTAAHGLRVALFCSGWSERLGIKGEQRDRLEVAALLHDIGKIGIPDRVLRKPGKLSSDEQLMMDQCPGLGCEILRGCTNDQALLDIIRYGGTWFESRRHGEGPSGDALPLGSRMLAIANAFDSMTIDHVYRPAMSRERAFAQLVHSAGSQFDPNLVADFGRMLEQTPEMMQGVVVNRWLQQLRSDDSQAFWSGQHAGTGGRSLGQRDVVRKETRFNLQLHQTLKDGVAYTDSEGVITQWNSALTRMTNIKSDAILGRQWSIETLGIRDARLEDGEAQTCPLEMCFRTGAPVTRSMVIERPGDDSIPVHVEVAPVQGEQPGMYGTVIVVHDLSDKKHLERRLKTLDHKTKTDGLTKVANRAHFDATLDELTRKTASGGPSFSLVICDIDHFKNVNDVHGHPAADEALKQFATLLKSHSRDGDLVARYGGEEFLLLAADCDNATASKRAEAIRCALEKLPIAALKKECITASFGVTEYQKGDTPETVLARADRALLKAKDNGRNRVVQLGTGKMAEVTNDGTQQGWLSWLTGGDKRRIDSVDIITPVPIDITIEKLRGFIADHDAEIINVAENQLSLKLMAVCGVGGRRRADQQIAMSVLLTLSEAKPTGANPRRNMTNTKVHVEMKPIRNRDRRRRELSECISLVVASLNSYLMGEVAREGNLDES